MRPHPWISLPLFGLALLGCPAEDKDQDTTDTTESELPSEYIGPEEDAPTAEFEADQLQNAIQVAVDSALTLTASPVLDAYASAVAAGQDETCPSTYVQDGNEFWFDQCTSSTGTSYSGYAFYYIYEDVVDPESGVTFNGAVLYGSAVVETPDGYLFASSGSAQNISYATEDGTTWQTVLQGTFSYDGPEADDTWMASGLAPDLYASGYKNTATGANYMVVSGGISGFDGPVNAVVFDEITIAEQLLGWPCEQEPNGSISVRSAEGVWYDVIFDGPDPQTFAMEDPEECDGCGEAYFRGEPVGEVCVDFSTLLAWEDTPWPM